MVRRVVECLRDQRAAAMEVLLLAERTRRAARACEGFVGAKAAAIMEAITWGNRSPMSRANFGESAAGKDREAAKPGGALRCEAVGARAPGPVAFGHTRHVHTGFTPEAEDVLEGNDGGAGDRLVRGEDHVPFDTRAVAAQVIEDARLLLFE